MHLHVISFDIPYPPNYGGVIDVYYKLKALREAGVKVHLHCFQYGRNETEDLKDICEYVWYYPRKSPVGSLPIRLPHIVNSRKSGALLNRLLKDSFPILFEGLHTCYYLDHTYLKFRHKLVRMHNIEWEYYYELAQREKNWSKEQYLLRESQLLQKFERRLALADHLLAISPRDYEYFRQKFNNVTYLPAFHPNNQVTIKPGRGKYCLYHGNLKVAENHEAAMFLIHHVFFDLDIPLIIAGADPLPELIEAISEYDHITLFHNPGEGVMSDLVRNAHTHVLPTFQPTGIKLKLLKALFNGRFIIVTPDMIRQNQLGKYCLVAQDTTEYRSLVIRLFQYDFPNDEISNRQDLLNARFSNIKNAMLLRTLLIEPEV